MTLKEFKNFIKNKPDDYIFKTKLTNVFSWRGSYDEVAFSLSKEECTKQELLDIINKAYARTFYGYKGGEYSYDDEYLQTVYRWGGPVGGKFYRRNQLPIFGSN